MINPKDFLKSLTDSDIRFFSGVPDSLLKEFCTTLETNKNIDHVIAANEGSAVAMAMGNYLSSKKVGCVYLQNSGLGNTINPLVSLSDELVYRIPMLLIVGWRGEPGVKDEPQHIKQGMITEEQLKLLNISYEIIDSQSDFKKIIFNLTKAIHSEQKVGALLIKKDSFSKLSSPSLPLKGLVLSREEAILSIVDLIPEKDLIISTTGKASRELFEIRKLRKQKNTDFLTVGGMGHTSSIALGVALGNKNKQVFCIDGDGSLIMHMGSMHTISNQMPKNFTHIVLNNFAHDSVGGQPTYSQYLNLEMIAYGMGYNSYHLCTNKEEITAVWEKLSKTKGPKFLEVRIKTGSRDNLGRPSSSPIENKKSFMEHAKY